MPKNKKEIKKKTKESQKRNSLKEFFTSSKILAPALVILILVLTHIAVEKFESKNILHSIENQEDTSGIEMNQLSKDAFNFIDDHRAVSNSSRIEFSEEAYEIALDMASIKSYDNTIFRRIEEINDFIRYTGRLSDYKLKYTVLYDLETSDYSGFRNSFNKKFSIKNTILQERYTSGAIGCEKSYCVLILLGNEEIELRKDY